MSHKLPRRRDVRLLCEEVFASLGYNQYLGKFDPQFLTYVRDLMRDGISFEDAVVALGEVMEEEQAAEEIEVGDEEH